MGSEALTEGDGCEQSHGAGKALCRALWTSVMGNKRRRFVKVDRSEDL